MAGKPKLWKVLVDGLSIPYEERYNVPAYDRKTGNWVPGAFMPPVMPVRICSSGYHLTTKPEARMPGISWHYATVYLAEPLHGCDSQSRNKLIYAFASVRLLRPMTVQEFRKRFSVNYFFQTKGFPYAMEELWARRKDVA